MNDINEEVQQSSNVDDLTTTSEQVNNQPESEEANQQAGRVRKMIDFEADEANANSSRRRTPTKGNRS